MSSNNENDGDEVATSSMCRKICSRRKELGILSFILFGILLAVVTLNPFLAIIWFLGVPGLSLLVRYLWIRICRDPFLAPSDNFFSICWEAMTTCPPDFRRTFPTIFFTVVICLSFSTFGLSRISADAVELNMFIVIFYNFFGALLILICAVWLVDTLWLGWLFIVVGGLQGNHGAAQNWWWGGKQPSEDDSSAEVENADENVDRKAKSVKLDEERRSAQIRAVATLIFFIWWTTWALAAAYTPQILELSVPIPRLPPQCDGYRLGMAADLHSGALAGVKETEFMVKQFNNLKPDAVALVGDIGDTSVNNALKTKLAPLADLDAPDGVFLSFGNHENMHNIQDYRNLFRKEAPFAGKVTLLENEHVVLNSNFADDANDCSIVLVGMADWSGRSGSNPGQVAPDFPLALLSTPGPNGTTTTLDSAPPSTLPIVMMQHQPANMVEMAKAGVGLQLSGHTHGGQIWPQHILLWNFDAISGLHAFDVGSADGPSFLFVTEGIVGWGPRLRFLCKTDLALLTLRSPSLMEAERASPDTSITVATAAMYASFVLVPLGVLACVAPFMCWGYKECLKRRS